MLIRFEAENFRSIGKSATLDLTVPDDTPDGPLIATTAGRRVCRMAALFGANASGKSNFLGAMSRLFQLLVEPRPAGIPVEEFPFRLDPARELAPTRLTVDVSGGERVWRYTLHTHRGVITRERLVDLIGDTERLVFERETMVHAGAVELKFASDAIPEDRREHARLASEVTSTTTPFLREAANRPGLEFFKAPYDALIASLFVEERVRRFMPPAAWAASDDVLPQVGDALRRVATGVQAVRIVRSPVQEQRTLAQLNAAFDASVASRIVFDGRLFERGADGVSRIDLVFVHRGSSGTDVEFGLGEESDGTRRFFELLGMEHQARPIECAVVDELDKSLHPNLLGDLIRRFATEQHTQLVFSTHDAGVMDLEIIPPEAFWFVEKSDAGETSIYPLTDFDPAQLTVMRKHLGARYREGRFGAVPFISDKRGN